jgi:hypothetical protein
MKDYEFDALSRAAAILWQHGYKDAAKLVEDAWHDGRNTVEAAAPLAPGIIAARAQRAAGINR